ncbi:MAG: DUF4007 family protein [Blastochloris sp.]|nr:DUF4007 family protein [Blastochloris sp.]
MRTLRFNGGFSLERDLIKGMLAFTNTGEATSNDAVGAYLGINPYKVNGLRGWFCKLGLGSTSANQYTLSPFGALVRQYDPELSRPGTLWLMHYFLASEHEECSEVWYQCFNNFLQARLRFTRQELHDHITQSLPENPSNKDGADKDVKELFKTYLNESALGGLKLITQQADKTLIAGMSSLPEPLIAAYILFDMWQRRYNEANTVRLSQLVNEPEGPGKIFVATSEQVRDVVLQLQAHGYVTYADTQHEPVTRRFHDSPDTLLEQFYRRA